MWKDTSSVGSVHSVLCLLNGYFSSWLDSPPNGSESSHYKCFMITLRHTTVGWTPLDEWSARRRHLYLTTHKTHKRQTSIPPVGFEPTIPTSAATGIGLLYSLQKKVCPPGPLSATPTSQLWEIVISSGSIRWTDEKCDNSWLRCSFRASSNSGTREKCCIVIVQCHPCATRCKWCLAAVATEDNSVKDASRNMSYWPVCHSFWSKPIIVS